jgi:hypothetical protein
VALSLARGFDSLAPLNGERRGVAVPGGDLDAKPTAVADEGSFFAGTVADGAFSVCQHANLELEFTGARVSLGAEIL